MKQVFFRPVQYVTPSLYSSITRYSSEVCRGARIALRLVLFLNMQCGQVPFPERIRLQWQRRGRAHHTGPWLVVGGPARRCLPDFLSHGRGRAWLHTQASNDRRSCAPSAWHVAAVFPFSHIVYFMGLSMQLFALVIGGMEILGSVSPEETVEGFARRILAVPECSVKLDYLTSEDDEPASIVRQAVVPEGAGSGVVAAISAGGGGAAATGHEVRVTGASAVSAVAQAEPTGLAEVSLAV
jgi:hypothetical protein